VGAFVATLRTQVDLAQRALARAGDTDEVHRHSARLLDLLERAAANGVDTTEWVPSDVVSAASLAAGNGA
jgi:hypothetical protein